LKIEMQWRFDREEIEQWHKRSVNTVIVIAVSRRMSLGVCPRQTKQPQSEGE